jgi:hypothetical protein
VNYMYVDILFMVVTVTQLCMSHMNRMTTSDAWPTTADNTNYADEERDTRVKVVQLFHFNLAIVSPLSQLLFVKTRARAPPPPAAATSTTNRPS